MKRCYANRLMRRLLSLAAFALFGLSGAAHGRFLDFPEPIDAVSFGMMEEANSATVRGGADDWTAWHAVDIENEHDPLLTESNLIVFDSPVTRLQILDGDMIETHPIRVAKDPAVRLVAATGNVGRSRILSRAEWGADENLLFTVPKPEKPVKETPKEKSENAAEPSSRIKDCLEAQENYPDEFRIAWTEKHSPDGKEYVWPIQYSPEVRLLIVHHTAMEISNDPRPAVERVRALYQFHAVNRGWGDIGYNYVIDEDGQIYEGRQGGDYAIGGHAYCNNTGSIGVALLGNFELEQPAQVQMQSLQWLLHDLAYRYDIPLDRKIRFHGKTVPTVVGHRDVISTDCPGYYAYGVMAQVRDHVRDNALAAEVSFPKVIAQTDQMAKKAEERIAKRIERVLGGRSTGPVDRRLAAKLKSQAVGALRRNLRNRVEDMGGTARPGYKASERVVFQPRSSVSSVSSDSSVSSMIRLRLTTKDANLSSCEEADMAALGKAYRGEITCTMIGGKPALINAIDLETYLAGLAEEPDSEPDEKQKAFAIAARSYAAYWMLPDHRKFEGMPYDGTDSPATFQTYGGVAFEKANPVWVKIVEETRGKVLTYKGSVLRAPYFSSDTGKTRTPDEAGWANFPLAEEVFYAKEDPWCKGKVLAGHGVGMSGCGAGGQAREGKTAEEILAYYYPGTALEIWPGTLAAR